MKANPRKDITDQKGNILFKTSRSYVLEIQQDIFDKEVYTVYCENKVPHDFHNANAFQEMFSIN